MEEALKEFYECYINEGVGIIANEDSGAMIYDEFIDSGTKIEFEPYDIKTEIWNSCKEDYAIISRRYNISKEKHKEELIKLYKCRLIELWLNIEAKKGIGTSYNISYPKQSTTHKKLRLIRGY